MPNANTEAFCSLVRNRSKENRAALSAIRGVGVRSQVFGILRQELDSLVRVMYLLKQSVEARHELIAQTLTGQSWRRDGRSGRVTDKEMVELADALNGWSAYVYKFGCAFIHLSQFHDSLTDQLDDFMSVDQLANVELYLHRYHGRPVKGHLTVTDISDYSDRIFDKIADNLECYLEALESGENGIV